GPQPFDGFPFRLPRLARGAYASRFPWPWAEPVGPNPWADATPGASMQSSDPAAHAANPVARLQPGAKGADTQIYNGHGEGCEFTEDGPEPSEGGPGAPGRPPTCPRDLGGAPARRPDDRR